MSPRISFSNDFIDTQHSNKHEKHTYREAPVASDFEFTVAKDLMITADELFSKGSFLPFKEKKITTLRDELLNEEDDQFDMSPRPPRGPMRWKGLLGLKRSNHNVPQKWGKIDETILVKEEVHIRKKISQEVLTDDLVSDMVEIEI
ncbi:hypothetical protein GIB67_008200 [Kingdonia uniflora]|uniref:Uncharacterized protein n=1 Tax=Kingdonia uniflora TaxID=39325 RepID=A0A7J7LNE3_9MAGN|nr:hypothetical protein GIB67_017622 [Kingdonia uniflora]KAF6148987.1 hypothetical protein GIB67_008200 [Kingdonia uniflora]